MRKQVKIVAVGLLIVLFVHFVFTTVQYYRRRAQMEMRFHNIMQIGDAYSRYVVGSGTNRPLSLGGLRTHLPAGFPLERYEMLPPATNELNAAIMREVTPDEAGRRVVLFADGHSQLIHK